MAKDPEETGEGRAQPYNPGREMRMNDDLPLEHVPQPTGMGLQQMLFGQLPYWGLARTIRACRMAMEEKLELVQVDTQLGAAFLEREKQKAVWENRGPIIEAVKLHANTLLDQAYVQGNIAKAARIDSEIALEEAKRRKLRHGEFADLNDERRKYEAEHHRNEAKAKRDKTTEEIKSQSAFEKALKAGEENRRNHDTLMKEWNADIQKHGGKEKMPEFLTAFYMKLEDSLGFRKR